MDLAVTFFTEPGLVIPAVASIAALWYDMVVVIYPFSSAAQALPILQVEDIVVLVLIAPELTVLEVRTYHAPVIKPHESELISLQGPGIDRK